MNCHDAKALLPGWTYGDLPVDTAALVATHLQSCPGCRADSAALGRVRGLLDQAAVPLIEVNVPRLYQQSLHEQQRQARRWRRAGIALLATAAGLLLLAMANLEIRIDDRQIVFRWGTVGDAPAAETRVAPVLSAPAPGKESLTASEWQGVRTLVNAVAEYSLERERDTAESFRELQNRLDVLEERLREHRETSRRFFAVLAAAQLRDR